MIRVTPDYIWDYRVKNLDLSNPNVLRWYLKRKIEHGDWEALDRGTLKKYLPKLKINPYLKQILQRGMGTFLKTYLSR